MDTSFCPEALDEALERYGPPEILNLDHGAHVAWKNFTDRLRHDVVKISMEGKGRCLYNVLIERL